MCIALIRSNLLSIPVDHTSASISYPLLFTITLFSVFSTHYPLTNEYLRRILLFGGIFIWLRNSAQKTEVREKTDPRITLPSHCNAGLFANYYLYICSQINDSDERHSVQFAICIYELQMQQVRSFIILFVLIDKIQRRWWCCEICFGWRRPADEDFQFHFKWVSRRSSSLFLSNTRQRNWVRLSWNKMFIFLDKV